MKKLELKLLRTDVMSEVSLATAYAGIKSIATEATVFNRVAAMPSDEELILRFWREMCGIVTEKLREFIIDSLQSDSQFSVTLRLSEAYDESLNPSVESDIYSAFTAGVIARWFRYSLPERSQEWASESMTMLERAYRKLYQRTPPRR